MPKQVQNFPQYLMMPQKIVQIFNNKPKWWNFVKSGHTFRGGGKSFKTTALKQQLTAALKQQLTAALKQQLTAALKQQLKQQL